MRDVLDGSMVPADHRRGLLRVIPRVIDEARRSLCAKDRRGAGVWHRNYDHLSLGNNSPPAPFRCDGSAACKAACGKLAVHAEERALLRYLSAAGNGLGSTGMDVLHLRVVDGEPVTSGPPSCATSCMVNSRMVIPFGSPAASGLRWSRLRWG
jgi:hypothetical protein